MPFWLGLVGLAMTGWLLQSAIRSYAAANASRHWSRVTGTIIESRAVKWKATSNHRTLFVTYRYSVEGRDYESTQASFYTLAEGEVDRLEREHQRSTTVAVYHDPHDHARATLVTGPHPQKPHSDVVLALLGLLVATAVTIAGYTGTIG